MSVYALQSTGFASGVLGTAGVFAATLMDVWCTRYQQDLKAPSSNNYKGLWKDCDVPSSGFPECQPLYSPYDYSGLIQAVRALMIVAILVSVIAVCIGFFCFKCLKIRSLVLPTRAKLILSAGILFFIAGLFGIIGASLYADQLVPSFSNAQYNQKQGEKGVVNCPNSIGATDSIASRYTFGPALYIAWVAGGLLILGGILTCIAFKQMQTTTETRETYIYNAPPQCTAADEDPCVQRVIVDQQI